MGRSDTCASNDGSRVTDCQNSPGDGTYVAEDEVTALMDDSDLDDFEGLSLEQMEAMIEKYQSEVDHSSDVHAAACAPRSAERASVPAEVALPVHGPHVQANCGSSTPAGELETSIAEVKITAAAQASLEASRKQYEFAKARTNNSCALSTSLGDVRSSLQAETGFLDESIQQLENERRQGAGASRSKMVEKHGVQGDPESYLKERYNQQKRRNRSLDVCFLVDNTGSMEWCIESIKEQIGTIMDKVVEAYPNALLRVAYIGYRDHFNLNKLERFPFTAENPVSCLKAFLQGVKAIRNNDDPEDVVGGLQAASQLDWQSATRLVIHFGDYPCHGRKYTDLPDKYPDGDPQGLTCEQFLRDLAAKGVDFHFARITEHTDRMIEIWQRDVFDHVAGATFEQHESTDRAEDFVPVVLRSISNSVSRSPACGHVAGSSAAGTPSTVETSHGRNRMTGLAGKYGRSKAGVLKM